MPDVDLGVLVHAPSGTIKCPGHLSAFIQNAPAKTARAMHYAPK
jgi:hypothetical protein